ncbi:MAG: DinB family protein [Candidatus Hydrogenedentes bacterium]|nr:DinB family protein [Candidatus Hydrogenedentota bacterium]
MDNPKIEIYRSQLAFCRTETVRVAEDVKPELRLVQLREGKAHPMWLIGHLTNTINTVVIQWMLGKNSLVPRGFSRKFAPDFAGGSPITNQASDYPAWEEVLGLYKQIMDCALENLAELNDSDLELPLKGEMPEGLRSFFSSNGRTLAIMASHDSYHRGQIGLLSHL